jgi:arylsulfatase A-like enzyme
MRQNTKGLLWPLLLLTGIVILIEVLNGLPKLTDTLTAQSFTQSLTELPFVIWRQLAWTIAVHIVTWLVFTLLIWWLVICTVTTLHIDERHVLLFGIGLWTVGVTAVFTANQLYFPLSEFAFYSRAILPDGFAWILLWLTCVILTVLFALALWRTLFRSPKRALFGVTVLLVIGAWLGWRHLYQTIPQPSYSQPDIVLLGLDSVRPDYLTRVTPTAPPLMPNLNEWLSDATLFANTSTPLARTYPALVSLLTGQYPVTHGIRYNLTSADLPTRNLASNLQQHGYYTFMATDERRFNPMDEAFGFDRVIGPKRGFNDYLLATYYDSALANLLVQTPLGRWLYPFNYLNRASMHSYYPDLFLAEIDHALTDRPSDQPLFLMLHLCTAHWPYLDASYRLTDKQSEITNLSLAQQYEIALQNLDRQLVQVIQLLTKHHLLQNSLIITYSDHGESLGLAKQRLTQSNHYQGNPDNSRFIDFIQRTQGQALDYTIGHGDDVLSPSQNQVLLAAQRFTQNKAANHASTLHFATSLIDIYPTIIDWLNIPSSATTSGISLAPYLQRKNQPAADRYLFIETGFNPLNLKWILTIATNAELYQEIHPYYMVEPNNGFVFIKPSRAQEIIHNKSYAVIYQNWLLALYSDRDEHIPVLINTKTQQWTDDLTDDFARQSPAAQMLEALQAYMAGDVD